MPGPSPVGVLQQAQAGFKRTAIRRQLQAVTAGKSETLQLDLDHPAVDVGALLEEATAGQRPESFEVQRLVVAFRNTGAANEVIERLAAKSPLLRARSARIIGALHLYEAVPWVARLLESRDRSVSDAAARALGKIGGAVSARALVTAIHRRGLNRRFVAELARSAPDLFIESALEEPQRPSVRPALAMAAGLRRHRTAVRPLLVLLEHGSRRERVISCRALGWIGATSAVPLLTAALRDTDWKTRMSAAKALGSLRARSARDDLKYLQIDPNAKVRKAAQNALHQLQEKTLLGA